MVLPASHLGYLTRFCAIAVNQAGIQPTEHELGKSCRILAESWREELMNNEGMSLPEWLKACDEAQQFGRIIGVWLLTNQEVA
jgi:hypothetical protein